MPLQPPDNEANPWKLIAAVPPQLRSQPVLNGYSMGGPLILSGIRPYVDGRGDMYGDELVVGYARHRRTATAGVRRGRAALEHPLGDASQREQARFRSSLASPGWRRVARDKVGAIYVADLVA